MSVQAKQAGNEVFGPMKRKMIVSIRISAIAGIRYAGGKPPCS